MRLGGIGTTYLGARPANGPEQRYATLWFTVLFVPIAPLRRSRLQLLPHRGGGFAVRELERTPLDRGEILRTYLFGWLLAPLWLFGPAVPAVAEVRRAIGIPDAWETPMIAAAIAWLAVWTWLLAERHERRFAGPPLPRNGPSTGGASGGPASPAGAKPDR